MGNNQIIFQCIKFINIFQLNNKEEKKPEDTAPVSNGGITASDDKERPNWGNGLEFLMSCISMSVGLGNIWRFPFTAFENGGGAFLIPYLVVLFFIGL